MKASVISHSYLAPENRKNIDELSRWLDVSVLLPDRAHDRIFDQVEAGEVDDAAGTYRVYPRIGIAGSQYLLASHDLGFRGSPPDIVHLEYDPWSAIFWQALVCRNVFASGARLICTVKNNTYRRYPGLLGTLKDDLAQAGIHRVDHFIAASGMVADLYHDLFEVPRERITVMTHLAVDTDLFAPLAPEARATTDGLRTVGYCGRLDPDKGVLELVDAVAAAREALGEDLSLELLGNGTLRESLTERAARDPWLRLREPIPHDEVPLFMRGVDLFVLPARVSEEHEEHDAHALIEAMAVGLPCIGTRSGIVPEILGDGSGVLVDANAAEPLAGAIVELGRDPGRMRELGSRSRAKALDSFSLEAVAAAKAAVYREVHQDAG